MFKEFADLKHVRGFKGAIFPLSIAFFIYTFGWGITAPMFSIFVNNVTGNLFLTGVILSITTMMGVFLNFPFGLLESKLNIKRVLQITLLVYSVMALLYPFANNVISLLSISIIRGIASSFLWLTSWSYIFYYAKSKAKGKETGFFSSMNDFASAISPVLGGAVAILSFFLPFYLLSATSFVSFIIISRYIKEKPKSVSTSLKKQIHTLSRYIENKHFIKTILVVVAFYAIINVYYSFIAVFLNLEGISIFLIGVLLTISLLITVVLEVPIGNLIDKHGIRKMLSIGVIGSCVAGIAFALYSNIVYLLIAISVFTIFYTVIFIGLYSRMSDIIKKDKTAMTGAIATFKDAGYTIGPLVAGFAMNYVSIKEVFIATALMFIILLPITASLHD